MNPPICEWCQRPSVELATWTDFRICGICLAELPEMPVEVDADDEVDTLDDEHYIYDESDDDEVAYLENGVRALEDNPPFDAGYGLDRGYQVLG